MLVKSFLNAPLTAKILTAPALCVIGAIMMGVVAYSGLSGIRDNLADINGTILPKAEMAKQLNETLASVQTRTFRALAWQTAGAPDAQIAKLSQEILRDVEQVSKVPADMALRFPLSAAEKERLGAIEATFKKYRKAVTDTLDLVSDPTVATTLMMQADRLHGELQTSVEALDGDIAKESRQMVEAASNSSSNTVVRFIGVMAGFLVLMGIVVPIVARLISFPVRRMTAAMGALASGDTSVDVGDLDRRDEIGKMATAVQVFKDNKIEADRLAEEQRREQEARAARAKRMEDLCRAFDATSSEAVRSVASAAAEMQSSSESMSATAEEATRQASAVAAASEQASANVQTVASAAEELSSSIAEISRQVTQASQIAASAVSEAEQTNVKVQGLAQAANKIGEVVALITDIAEQTNLLALNATIEAARAGDAGKGFAVVASEVKNLANQTAKATDEIGAQIAGIQSATQEAVSAIESITKTISKINEVNAGVASAVEEQGAATQEIARNVEQAAAGTQEVSSNIGGVSQAANETGTAAEQIHHAAGELSQQSETLRAEVDKFLANVRAA